MVEVPVELTYLVVVVLLGQYAYAGRGAPGGSGGGGGGQPGPYSANGGYYSFGVGGVAQGNNGGRGNYICAGTSPSVPGANCNAGGAAVPVEQVLLLVFGEVILQLVVQVVQVLQIVLQVLQ